jgi:hypothetical protein
MSTKSGVINIPQNLSKYVPRIIHVGKYLFLQAYV